MNYLVLGLFSFLITTGTLTAQTRQEVYCNPAVVWAGSIDIDIVPDAVEKANWDEYSISGLSNNGFQQKTKNLNAPSDQTMAELVIGASEEIDFYESSELKNKISYQDLDLGELLEEPNKAGELIDKYPPNNFNVFRIRSLIYYNKEDLSFHVVPEAIAVLHPQYDVAEEIVGYNLLGWLPVGTWAKNVVSKSWTKRIYRDFPIQGIRILKQVWTLDKVFDEMLIAIRAQAEELRLGEASNLDGTRLLTVEAIKMLGLEEDITDASGAYEEMPTYLPMYPSRFTGINLSLDWNWNTTNNRIELRYHGFAPIYQDLDILCDDCDQEALQYLFVKVVGEK